MSNRNTNARFELAPQVETERSTFNMDCNVKTTFNVGQLVPFYLLEVLPGDTFEVETAKVCRLQTLITPVMDNLYLDTYYFFVPNRLVWDKWKNFCGESERAWYPANEYTIPQITTGANASATVGTVWDYFGLPVNVKNLSVSALPFRAYCKIVDDWFRDENLEDPIYIPTNSSTTTLLNTEGDSTTLYRGCKPYIVNKYHDYFTSCLPGPQKGPEVTFLDGFVPVITGFDEQSSEASIFDGERSPMQFRKLTDYTKPSSTQHLIVDTDGELQFNGSGTAAASNALIPTNLYAQLDYTDGTGYFTQENTINSLRQAFQIQRLLERDARAGTRYIEVIQAHFGVTSPDARLQRAEYLGGNRVPFNIEQVTQTNNNDDNETPIGYQAGWSQTNDDNYDFSKSFTEHGYIIGVMCARYDHTYQQGINRMWSRKTRFDFYWPALAHLGEQAVLNKEIYAQGTAIGGLDDQVFGYQEAWAEYRFIPNYVTGEMRAGITNSLSVWNFADNYNSAPHLSRDWMKENKSNIDRSLAVTSNVSNQILCDIMIHNKATRPMPLYSIPGLIDHF